jgi:hypothetical protein
MPEMFLNEAMNKAQDMFMGRVYTLQYSNNHASSGILPFFHLGIPVSGANYGSVHELFVSCHWLPRSL